MKQFSPDAYRICIRFFLLFFSRVIYVYNKDEKITALIEFIEIYFKGNKSNEDRDRIEDYINLFI